jgi:multimeric flavodoxin WrbA
VPKCLTLLWGIHEKQGKRKRCIMVKKILIINGSLSVRGNTDTLIANLLNGTKNTNIIAIQYFLRDKNIADCRGCYHCYKKSSCAIKDDMQEIHGEIQNSDLLILASPLYWWGVTGLMKTFIDRLYLYYPRTNTGMIAGKKAIIITPMHVNEIEHGEKAYKSEIEPITMTYNYILGRLGVDIVDMIFYPGLSNKGDAGENKEYLNNAYKIGKGLCELK